MTAQVLDDLLGAWGDHLAADQQKIAEPEDLRAFLDDALELLLAGERSGGDLLDRADIRPAGNGSLTFG